MNLFTASVTLRHDNEKRALKINCDQKPKYSSSLNSQSHYYCCWV